MGSSWTGLEGAKKERKKLYRYYGLLILAAVFVYGAATMAVGWYGSRPVQRLPRPEGDQGVREEQLLADNGEETVPVTVRVAPREKTAEELEALFTAAQAELAAGLPGNNGSLSCVTEPLYMPVTAQDGQILVSWSCDQPEYVSYDGTLGEDIPSQGVTVQLSAALQCQQQVRWYREQVTVCKASAGAGGAGEDIAGKLEAEDTARTTAYYELPRTLGQQKMTWYRRVDNPAPYLAAALLLVGILLPLRAMEEKKAAAKRYRDGLLRFYPALVSQTMLYLGAGMSLKQAFSCMATPKRPGDPTLLERECAVFVREMEQGVPEAEAIRRLGERSGLWEYRTFCGMLIQNRKKGNASLLPMLQNEAEKAFAERQRRARIMGNEAGTRLLMPMMLMLLVVLIIVLFPAMTSFYT